nr:zinc-ribbon domain-containing protein [Rhodococcus opacus]
MAWRCSVCGYCWSASPSNRVRQRTGCKKCASRRNYANRTDLKSSRRRGIPLAESLLAEWHEVQDSEVDPRTLTSGSGFRARWVCSVCRHHWSATVSNRHNGSGCPECAARTRNLKATTPLPGESLAELRPDLAEEWDDEFNDDPTVTPKTLKTNSGYMAKWRCRECDHRWQAEVRVRTRLNTGCRPCASKQRGRVNAVAAPGTSFADLFPELVEQLVVTSLAGLKIEEVKPYSNARVMWRCDRGHTWPATFSDRANGKGCGQCQLSGTSATQIRLAHELAACGMEVDFTHPPIRVPARDRPVRADIVVPTWRLVIEFDGSYYHSRPDAEVQDRAQSQHLREAGWSVMRIRESPLKILDDGDIAVPAYLSPKELTAAVVNALESRGYSVPLARQYATDPELWGKEAADVALARVRAHSLASERPDIAEEWHYELNGTIRPEYVHPGANEKFWFQCHKCDHVWEAWLPNRTGKQGSGCPECGKLRSAQTWARPRPGMSLADKHPEIVASWHPTRNDGVQPTDVRPGSHEPRWWICPRCGEDWESTPKNRAKNKGCSGCVGKQHSATVSRQGKSVAEAHPHLVVQWHPTENPGLSPDEVGAGSGRDIWWRCQHCGHEWQSKPYNRARNGGTPCPECKRRP